MTAELSILNKSGVVIAADSAVTIGRNNKVFNNANKLFKLSEVHPVGLMIYNNANWMGIPLEIIVKDYNKRLETKSFPELKDYARDFIEHIKINYFKEVDSDDSIEVIKSRMYEILERLIETVKEDIESRINNETIEEPKDDREFNVLLNKEFTKLLELLNENLESQMLIDFEGYSLNDFKDEFKTEIDKILKGFYSVYSIVRTAKMTNILYNFLFKELTSEIDEEEEYSGIVIAGYGNDQIFPALTEIYLAEMFSNRLRYQIKKDKEITHNGTAIVIPFAQRDMVDTFFQGVDPKLLEKYDKQIADSFEELIKTINEEFKLNKEIGLRKKFQKQYQKLSNRFLEIRNEIHVQPIVNSISYLPKEELIELAESLVNITSLKRKTSNDIHSVGGPIDIALISKCDGFQWIKKK